MQKSLNLFDVTENKEAEQWVRDNSLGYIFFSKKDGVGYCERCRTEFPYDLIKPVRGGQFINCPVCNHKGITKHKRYQYKANTVSGLVIVPENINGDVMLRYYETMVHHTETETTIEINERMRDISDENGVYQRIETDWYGEWKRCNRDVKFNIYNQCIGLHGNPGAYKDYVRFKSEGIKSVIKGTVFENCGFDNFVKYKEFRKQEFLIWADYYAYLWNYKEHESWNLFFEYLSKVGFENLYDYFQEIGLYRHNFVRENKRSLIDMLLVNKEQYKELLARGNPTFDDLMEAQIKTKWNLRTSEEYELYKLCGESYGYGHQNRSFETLKDKSKFSMHKIYRYLVQDNSADSNFTQRYLHYIDVCEKLKLDLKKTSVAFPRCLSDAIVGVETALEERKLAIAIEERKAEKESQMDYVRGQRYRDSGFYLRSGNYIVRSARSYEELVNEGFNLGHCTGKKKYIDAVKSGDVEQVLFVRKAKRPDVSYFTMEVKHGKVTQCFGRCHSPATTEMKELSAIVEEVLNKKWLPCVVA